MTAAHEPGKRAAFESGLDLARPLEGPRPMKRPLATTMGAVLVGLRVIAGFAWLGALALVWEGLVADAELVQVDDPAVAGWVLVAIVGVGSLFLLAQFAVAWFVYRGANWARILVMSIATLSVLSSGVEYFAGGNDITFETTLVTLALDILVLLALSSRAARDYARRGRGTVAG
ncbi:hypothetical protein [Agromyces sp. SYSU T00194]|uniref:hypothetical protein n=1 Tax=Agromyces chitinivorans TaxID=3158560 RepID=UPI00339623E9